MNAYLLTGSDLRALGYELAPDGDYLMTEATIERIEYLVGRGCCIMRRWRAARISLKLKSTSF